MSQNFAPIKQRIIEFIEIQGIKKDVFFSKLGIAASNFRGKSLLSEIGGDAIAKILTEHSNLNSEWLITGKGQMLKTEDNIVAEPEVNYQAKSQVIEIESTGEDNVIMLDAKAAAYTFSRSYNTPITLDNVETFKLPKLGYRSGTFYLIQIDGDSMYPTVLHGDYLACKRITIDEFIGGYVHVLWHEEYGLLCKRIRWKNKKEGTVLLESDNEYISTISANIVDISAVLEVECKVSYNLQKINDNLRKDVSELQVQMVEVLKALKKIQ